VAFCYPASRDVPDRRYSPGALFSQPASVSLDQIETAARFNEQRLNGEPSHQDRSLRAVRTAIEAVVPEISRLRVKRSPLQLVARKKGIEFRLDQLSGGERGLLAMVGDLAYRLTLAYPELPDPLQGEALVLIDEIEQHLHPAWQRIVAGQLQKSFPGCRFVLTTHSPQVLSEVPSEAVLLLKDFQVYHPAAPTEGRDTNAILEEVFDVASRPDRMVRELEYIGEMLDEGQQAAARDRLDRLAESLTERDPGVARLRALLDVMERIDASHPQGVRLFWSKAKTA
jgi:predicted ATP-binding protein involved in virulence